MINYVHSSKSSYIVHGNVAAVMCEVNIEGNSILLGRYYRPPNSSQEYDNQIKQTLRESSNTQAYQVLMCGGFKCKEIDWENHYVRGSPRSEQNKFYEECHDAFLHQHVTEFTRGSDDPSLLDLVLARSHLQVSIIRVQSSSEGERSQHSSYQNDS